MDNKYYIDISDILEEDNHYQRQKKDSSKSKQTVNKTGIAKLDNLYRARFLILVKAREIYHTIYKVKELQENKKRQYASKIAEKLVIMFGFPKYWVDVLTSAFIQGKLNMPADNMGCEFSEDRSEIIIKINKFTTREEWLNIWNTEITDMQKLLHPKYNKFEPFRISRRDFIYAFIELYKEENAVFEKFIDLSEAIMPDLEKNKKHAIDNVRRAKNRTIDRIKPYLGQF